MVYKPLKLLKEVIIDEPNKVSAKHEYLWFFVLMLNIVLVCAIVAMSLAFSIGLIYVSILGFIEKDWIIACLIGLTGLYTSFRLLKFLIPSSNPKKNQDSQSDY